MTGSLLEQVRARIEWVICALPTDEVEAARAGLTEVTTRVSSVAQGSDSAELARASAYLAGAVEAIDQTAASLVQAADHLHDYLAALGFSSTTADQATIRTVRSARRAVVDARKFDYLFGTVSSGTHNAARSTQNAAQLARIGVHDDHEGRALLRAHFDTVVRSDANIVRSFDTEYGTFQIRDSLFAGPRGLLHFESTWQVDTDGLRLTTVIPRGGM